MEKLTELKAYQAIYLCDECGEPMENDGLVYSTYPPMYPHACKNGHKITLDHRYPRIVYEKA